MSVFLGRSGFRRRLREFNPCHDPKTGMFAPKGQGECGPGNWEDAGRQRSIYGNFIDDPNLTALDRQEATELGRAVNQTQESDANDQKHALAQELAASLREKFDGRMHLVDELHDELLRRGLDTHIDEVVHGSDGNSSEYPDPADVESDYEEYKEQAEEEAMEAHDQQLSVEYEIFSDKIIGTVRDYAEQVLAKAEEIQAERREAGEVDPTTQGTLPEFDPRTNSGTGLRVLMEHALGKHGLEALSDLDEGESLQLEEVEVERIREFLSRKSAYSAVVDDVYDNEDIKDVLKDSGHEYFDGNSYGDGFSKWREDNSDNIDMDNVMSFNSWYSDRYGIDPDEWNSGDGNGTVSREDFEDTAYAVSSFLLHTWAETSGDSNVVSVGLQQAAEKVFDLGPTYAGLFVKDKHNAHGGGEEFIRRTRAFYDGHKEVLDSFLKGMYENTQKFLSEKYKGDYVTLYRGMKPPSSPDAGWESLKGSVLEDSRYGAMVDVLLQPVSSFSISLNTARNFSHGGAIFAVRVPKSRILSTTATGFGAMNEYEVTVLGGRYPAFTVRGGDDSHFWKVYESYKRKQPIATDPFPGEAW